MPRTNDEVEVVRVEENESWVAPHAFQLTDWRKESLASWLALPRSQRGKGRSPKNVMEMAASLGVTGQTVRRWAKDRRVLEGVRERLRAAATLAMPDVLERQAKRAIRFGAVQSANFVAEQAGMTKSGSVFLQQQINVNHSAPDQVERDKEFYRRWAKAVGATQFEVIESKPAGASTVETNGTAQLPEETGPPNGNGADQTA